MFEEHLQNTLILLKNQPVLAFAVAALVILLGYYKPRQMFRLVLLGLVLAAIIYVTTLFSGTLEKGGQKKDQMIHKSRDALDE